jgi:hypothetical protein
VIDRAELRRRLEAALAAEESDDWEEVERLSEKLNRELSDQNFEHSTEIVNHYLDDADIRQSDPRYGNSQREELRRFIETGEDRTTYLPPWSCAVVFVLLIAAIAYWLAF